MSVYRVTMTETMLKAFKVEAESYEEAEEKFKELLNEGYFNGPLEVVDDSTQTEYDVFEPDDPCLRGVPTYEQALVIAADDNKVKPFVEISWSRFDVEHVLNVLGFEDPSPEMIEEAVKAVEKQLKDVSIEKGWDIIETWCKDRFEQTVSPLSRAENKVLSSDILDHVQNAVNDLQLRDSHTYRRLIDIFDGSEIDLVIDIADRAKTLTGPGKKLESVLQDFLVDSQIFYPEDAANERPSLTTIAEQAQEARSEAMNGASREERDGR